MSGKNHRKEIITGFVIITILAIVILSANHFTQGLGNDQELSEEMIIGSGEGYKGEIVIQIIMEEHNLKGLKAIEFHDTSQVFNEVLKSIEKDLLDGKSLEEIEVITGATDTYHGIIEALEEAFFKLEH